jgi:hypothetical protein
VVIKADAGVSDAGPGDNQPPTANADQANAEPAAPIYIRVLDNDSDPDDDLLKISEVTQPQNGQVTRSFANTTLTYASDSGYAGDDTFEYTISDGNGGTASAQVTVSVAMAVLPTLVITSPRNNATIMGSDVTISFTADCAFSGPSQNRNGCHGHKYLDGSPYSADTGRTGHYTPAGINLTGLMPGEHTFRLALHKNDGTDDPFSPSVEASVTFTIE